MLNKRRQAAQTIIDALMPAEEALDLGIQRLSELATALPAARLSAGVAAEVGHEALEEAAAAFAASVKARTHLVAAHRALARTRTSMGLDTVSFGGLMPKAAELKAPLEIVRAA